MNLCLVCNADLPAGSIASRRLCDECIRRKRNRRKVERDKQRRAEMGMSERLYRKTVARGAPSKGRWCRQCEGMAHRRPEGEACACGLGWAPDANPRPLPSGGAWWWCR